MDIGSYGLNVQEALREPRAGEYRGIDGLIYCEECGQPVQFRMTAETFANSPDIQNLKENKAKYQAWANQWFGTFPIKCKCGERRLRKQEQESKRAEREKLRTKGLRDRRLKESRFDKANGSNAKQAAALKRYADKFEETKKYSLLIYGPSGTGKSFLTGCIANALTDNNHYVYCTTVFQALEEFRTGKQQELLKEIRSCDLMILDGIESVLGLNSGHEAEWIFNLIEERQRTVKPLIVTTQVATITKGSPITKRIFAKFKDFIRIELKESGAHNNAELMDLLRASEAI